MELPTPGLPSFDYIRAVNLDEVVELLLEHPDDAALFMGGTDIFVQMRDGLRSLEMLVDVKHLPGMSEIAFDAQSGLQIGAAVDLNTIAHHPAVLEHYPLLTEAICTIASYQVRSRATMGGNLCNASPAADTAPVALVLKATLVAWGPEGERVLPATEFFLGVGKTALKPGELLTRIDLPVPPPGLVGRYLKLGRNTAGDLAIVGVAVIGYPDESALSGCRFRIALASVAPTPICVPDAETILAQEPLTEKTIDAAAEAARAAAQPIDDVRASAPYRRAMVENMTRRALLEIWATLQGNEE